MDSVFKEFNTYNKDVVSKCKDIFNFAPFRDIIAGRKQGFSLKYRANVTKFEVVKLIS